MKGREKGSIEFQHEKVVMKFITKKVKIEKWNLEKNGKDWLSEETEEQSESMSMETFRIHCESIVCFVIYSVNRFRSNF